MRYILMIWVVVGLATTAAAQDEDWTGTPTYDPPIEVALVDPMAGVVQRQAPQAFRAFQRAAEVTQVRTVDLTQTTDAPPAVVVYAAITASADLTEAAWDSYLLSQWPVAMADLARQLVACGCTWMGLPEGAELESVARVYGCCRAIRLRFSRDNGTMTAAVDAVAGR